MVDEVSALLVYKQEEPLGALAPELKQQFIKTCRAETCQEAARLLDRVDPPRLIFTDTTLPDGNWRDMLGIAERAREAVNVVVVARFLDVELYLETMERGACDFIVPPFLAPDLAHVVVCAMEGAASRRGGRVHAA